MNSFRVSLNKGSSNYSFFDPDSRLNLSLSNPIGFANRITPLILKGVRYGALIDIDKVIDLETGGFKVVKTEAPVAPTVPPKEEELPTGTLDLTKEESVVEETESEEKKTTTKKSSRK